MLTKTVDMHKAPKDLRDLLSLVMGGTEIIFMEDDTPIARLVSIGHRVAGLHNGAIWTSPDFDELLPEEFWAGNA